MRAFLLADQPGPACPPPTRGRAAWLDRRVSFLELAPPVPERALEPLPMQVRTLDALHLAPVDFLRRLAQDPFLATCETRLAEAAQALAMPLQQL